MMKASVTLGLVFGAALFAVLVMSAQEASAATVADIPNNAWSGSGTSYPEPPVNADGTVSYNPFQVGSVKTTNTLMGSGSASIIDANPTLANEYGLGFDLKTNYGYFQNVIYGAKQVDLNKKFTQKSNLYFGDSSSKSGDGLGFVLVSDPSELGKAGLLTGNSLSIWGSAVDANGPTALALPNSFAIVMDTLADHNRQAVSATESNLDQDVNYGSSAKQYVGYGYPSQSSMYKNENISTPSNDKPNWKLNYSNSSDTGYQNGGNYNLVTNTLNNGAWQKFQVDWVPDGSGGGKLTYTLKICDSSGNVQQTITRTVTWSKSDVTAIFGGTTTVTWGYVGSRLNGTEPHVVTFDQIGPTEVSLSSHLADMDTNAQVTSAQLDQSYVQTYEITMPVDSPDWPSDASKMSAILQTSKNYSFVKNSDGKVDVAIGLKVYHAEYIDAQHIKISDTNPGIDPITAKSVNKGDGSSSQPTDNLIQTEVKATGTDKSLEGKSTVTIRMGTGDTIRQAGTVLPVPQKDSSTTTNILLPSFTFEPFSVADFLTTTRHEGKATTNASNKLTVTTDGKGVITLDVYLKPFGGLAQGYTGGKVDLSFTFNGQPVKLTDVGKTEKQKLSLGTSVPDTSIDEPKLTVHRLTNVTTGHKKAYLDWTVGVVPATEAAAK
jgi:hypothetical protein